MMKLIDNVLFLVLSLAATTKANPLAGGVPVESVQAYPFMAALLRDGNCFCGGSIIGNRNILTAAHCLVKHDDNFDRIKVGVGTINWMNVPEDRIYNIKAWITHKDFPKKKSCCQHGENDIALIRVDRDIDFSTPEVKWIPLDLTNFAQQFEEIFLIGFGRIGNKCKKKTRHLHQLESLVWNNENYFQQKFSNRPGLMEKIYCTMGSSKMGCLNSRDRFTGCKGDSGGPVIAKDPKSKEWKLVAVIDSGNSMVTYTAKVFAYLDWINEAKISLTIKFN